MVLKLTSEFYRSLHFCDPKVHPHFLSNRNATAAWRVNSSRLAGRCGESFMKCRLFRELLTSMVPAGRSGLIHVSRRDLVWWRVSPLPSDKIVLLTHPLGLVETFSASSYQSYTLILNYAAKWRIASLVSCTELRQNITKKWREKEPRKNIHRLPEVNLMDGFVKKDELWAWNGRGKWR